MPLGHWLHPTHQLHKFVYNTTHDTIIETFKNGNLYEYARRDGITRFSQVFLFSGALHSLPENVLPTTVTRVSDDVIHGESHLELVHTIPTPIHHSWKDYLLNLPDDVRYLLTFQKFVMMEKTLHTPFGLKQPSQLPTLRLNLRLALPL